MPRLLLFAGMLVVCNSFATVADVKEKPITSDDRAHWAFRPLARPELPDFAGAKDIKNPIDRWIRAKLVEAGLKPSLRASRSVLIRRLSFDLIGLPPTPEEVTVFENDKRPDAYERLVDRLLKSPHYGERWAQHWLDLARYADTDGFEFDQARPNAWRYRDWVVKALNDDMPYNRFVTQQIAGDESTPDDPSGFVATGFNRCYPDMVDLNDQALRRQNALNDITDTTGLVFLGLTIGCARCHDHKFEPISQADYYRLQAFFTPARFRDDFSIATSAERAEFERKRDAWQKLLMAAQSRVMSIEEPVRAKLAAIPTGATDDIIVALQKSPDVRTSREIGLIYDAQRKDKRISDRQFAQSLDGKSNEARLAALRDVDQLRKNAPASPPQATGIDEPASPPALTFLLKRGDFYQKGQQVEPGVPRVLLVNDDAAKLAIAARPSSSGRRLALANWLTSSTNPLTSRVMVNRVWQRHFGRGLVAMTSDFGTQTDEPSHPELLDWLSAEFIAQGWSLKTLHRLIVTSETYRQSSVPNSKAADIDPTNELLWRQNRQRLDGEAIRDSLLAVSGQLNLAIGGPCVFPELPDELKKLSNKGETWPVSKRVEDRNRRSLYVFTRRNLRYPFFEVFDRPDTNASCPQRPVSTIAPQALTLLNSTLSRQAAKALAEQLNREPVQENRIARAYQLTLARAPSHEETELANEFLKHAPLEDFCLALLNINEFIYID